ncbi:unnamed protein product [Mytilus coruscus]|uniref:Uncharacterized protein n=1 Tax=Mytilus coruscus TaxID=42192 RepID=A0A6J8ENW3_MYTCO|nr:unnamed protein product [Mytilus coruscus]
MRSTLTCPYERSCWMNKTDFEKQSEMYSNLSILEKQIEFRNILTGLACMKVDTGQNKPQTNITEEECEIFNDFFVNVAKNIGSNQIKVDDDHPSILAIKDNLPDLDQNSFTFSPIDKDFVEKRIGKINVKKATEIDGISPKLLHFATALVKPLTDIVNISLCVLEKGNYRPEVELFLEKIVNADGIFMAPSKVDAELQWHRATNRKEKDNEQIASNWLPVYSEIEIRRMTEEDDAISQVIHWLDIGKEPTQALLRLSSPNRRFLWVSRFCLEIHNPLLLVYRKNR